MPAKRPDHKADVARLVEKQMRNWELSRSQQPRTEAAGDPDVVQQFVTVSRMVGAGGKMLAERLTERIGWPVFDKELLTTMAGDDGMRARVYNELDERDVGWVEDTFRWLVEGGADQSEFFARMVKTVLALARHGNAIFLGRGSDLILPRDRGLRVRLVAPPEACAERFAQRENISPALARAEVDRIQNDRTQFVRSHFGKAATSPTRHDLVFNTGTFDIDEVADLVCRVLSARGITE